MSRPKGSKNKAKETNFTVNTTPSVQVKEIFIEKIIEIPAKALKDLALWKQLAKKGFPQGGSGNWIVDPADGNKYYIPQPSELYQSFVNDPKDWTDVGEALGRVWLEKHK